MHLLAELVIPLLAEPAYQGFFEVFVEWHAGFTAFAHRRAADVPLVVVERDELAVVVNPNGIEMARHRLHIICLAVAEGFLYGTEGFAVLPHHVGTLAIVHQRGAWLAGVVVGRHSLRLHRLAAGFGHIGSHLVVDALQNRHLIFVKRRAGIAFHAALPFTLRQVAAKAAVGDIL